MSNVNGILSNIAWEVQGTAPNREAVIQWTKFRPMYSSSTTNAYGMTFQIRLSETTGTIKIVYEKGSYVVGSTAITPTATTLPQIGLRGASNADFNNRVNSDATLFTNSSAGTLNSDGQWFSTTATVPGMPSDGLTYTWTPPTCGAPAGITVNNITATTATVTWSAPPTPGISYDLYYSSASTPPTSSTVPSISDITGFSANLGTPTALLPSTTYFVWVRTKCSATEYSNWSLVKSFNTECLPPAITSVTGATVCFNGAATLSADAPTATEIKWYSDATSTTPLGTGPTFTTPPLTTTTDYYVEASIDNSEYVGPINPNALTAGSSTGASTTYYVEFVVSNEPVTIQSVDVFPNAVGQNSTLTFHQGSTTSALHTIQFVSDVASNGITPQTVPINLTFDPGTYRVKLTGGNYYRNYQSNAAFPYNGTNFSITGGSNIASNSYYFVYNFKIENSCDSPRQVVTATVDPNCLGTDEVGAKKEVKVYPNPFTDVINISDIENVKSISVNDASGKLVKVIEKVSDHLNLGDLEKGMYLLNITYNNGKTSNVKVMKK